MLYNISTSELLSCVDLSLIRHPIQSYTNIQPQHLTLSKDLQYLALIYPDLYLQIVPLSIYFSRFPSHVQHHKASEVKLQQDVKLPVWFNQPVGKETRQISKDIRRKGKDSDFLNVTISTYYFHLMI